MATEETGMKTYQIEITDSTSTPVKRFYGDMPDGDANAMLNEYRELYDSSHTLELSNKRTGQVIRSEQGQKG